MENSDKRTYQLSLAAEEDLQFIFDYTQQEFGVAQAVLYLEGIEKLLLQLQSNPSQGAQSHGNLRRAALNSFSEPYYFLSDYAWPCVVRVLHGSRDIPALLENVKIES